MEGRQHRLVAKVSVPVEFKNTRSSLVPEKKYGGIHGCDCGLPCTMCTRAHQARLGSRRPGTPPPHQRPPLRGGTVKPLFVIGEASGNDSGTPASPWSCSPRVLFSLIRPEHRRWAVWRRAPCRFLPTAHLLHTSHSTQTRVGTSQMVHADRRRFD